MLTALIVLVSINTSKAQVSFSVHIGTPPVWAPPAYAHTVRYYYIPEMDCYYDASRSGYYYNNGGSWVFSAYAPAAYRGYDVGRFHHIVVNYNGNRPYDYFRGQRYAYVQRYHRGEPVREYRRVSYAPRERWGDDGYERRGHEDGRGRWHDNGRGHGHDD
jgi:hypothetical protein